MAGGRPRVSVVMPARDAAPHVREALVSILEQTVSELEVIVVDDGSADATAEIVAGCGRADTRVRLVMQERAGVVFASERARQLARAPVIARMDADDIAHPERLELQLERLERGDVGACGGQVELFPSAEVTDGMRRYESWLNSLTSPELAARDVFVECPIAHPTLALRLTRTDQRYSNASFVRCRVHHLRRLLGRRSDAVVVFGCGPVGKAFARELQRQGSGVAAFLEVDPRKIGKIVHGAPVHGMEDVGQLVGMPAVGAVAGPEGRAQVREAAREAGWTEGGDFFAVA